MKIKLFYGWYIVAAGVLINAFIGGVIFYGFTALVNPISTSLGWSYAQISLAMSIRGAETGVLSPFMGRLVDRFPARWLILAGVVMIGLGYFCLSRCTTLAMFYASFIIIAFGGSLGITMAPTTTIARWFRKNLGKANGVLAFGFGLGGLSTPLVVKMIDAFGWRNAVALLAAVMIVVGVPLAFVFRTRPEDHGMLPDGEVRDSLVSPRSTRIQDTGMTVKEALKARAFWQTSLASMLQVAATATMSLHVMPYLTGLGVERTMASMIAMAIPLISLPARFVFGWLSDIFPKKFVYATSITLTSTGVFVFSLVDSSSFGLIILSVILAGLGLGGLVSLRAPIVREYFGMKNFGSVLGLVMGFVSIGTMVAPLVAGWVRDTRGVYDPIWLILSGVALLGTILMLTAPLPSRLPAPSPVPKPSTE